MNIPYSPYLFARSSYTIRQIWNLMELRSTCTFQKISFSIISNGLMKKNIFFKSKDEEGSKITIFE